MVSLTVVSLLKLPDDIMSNFEALITAYHQLTTFLWSNSGVFSFFYTFLAITAPAWLLFYSKNNKIDKRFVVPEIAVEDDVNGEATTFLSPVNQHAASHGKKCESVVTCTDDEFGEEMQFHEALDSIFTWPMPIDATSSDQEPIPDLKPVSFESKIEDSSLNFCGICLENKQNWEMFGNDKCSHTFCYDCTSGHIIAKVQDKVKTIACPAPDCKADLNPDTCRLIIPDEAIVQWDEFLCLSLISESHKLYCPFRDCSALLVNDLVQVSSMQECPLCKRSFCARCRVPWHSEFTCKEFQKLYARKKGKDDKIVKMLAKKKNWQKCPKCKMYVEKNEGCVHMTCRCKFEFCYRCGAKWSDSHGACRPKS